MGSASKWVNWDRINNFVTLFLDRYCQNYIYVSFFSTPFCSSCLLSLSLSLSVSVSVSLCSLSCYKVNSYSLPLCLLPSSLFFAFTQCSFVAIFLCVTMLRDVLNGRLGDEETPLSFSDMLPHQIYGHILP